MDPINYRLNVPNPIDALMKGMQGGIQLRGLQQEQELQRQQAEAQNALRAAQAQKAEAEMQDILRAQSFQDQLREVMSKPNFDLEDVYKIAALTDKDTAEAIKKGAEGLAGERKRKTIEEKVGLISALRSDNPEYGVQIMQQKADAYRADGDEAMARNVEVMIEQAKDNPKAVSLDLARNLAFMGEDGKRALESLAYVDKAPVEQREAEAKATQEEVKAKYADSAAAAELEKKGWDIKKIQSDMEINRMNSRIYAMNAALSRESNDLKRQELRLKISEAERDRDSKIREKAAEAETAIASLDDASNTLADILSDEDTLRSSVGTSAWRGSIPGTKARTMAGKLEQLQNMMTEANLGKLKGAMSDSDLKFLRNIGTNMDRYQNENAFISELKRIQKVIDRASESKRRQYGVPKATIETIEVDY